MMHQIDTNDLEFLEKRHGKFTSWIPDTRGKKGEIHPNVTTCVRDDGKLVSVFHVKPVYYETPTGHWRPLSEVTLYHGNHQIILNENWWQIHPRYLNWLDKRCKLIGGQLLIPSSLKSYPTPYTGVVRSIHESLVPLKMGLTASTFYPDPDTETTTVDGYVGRDGVDETWNTTTTATTGASNSDSSISLIAYVGDYTSPDYNWCFRSFMLFDTSAISDTDTIDSGTFSVYQTASLDPQQNTTLSYGWNALVGSTPNSNTAIVAGDYDQVGSTEYSDTHISGTGAWTTANNNTWHDWTLNATGLSNVSKTGVTKLASRHGNDLANVEPTYSSGDDYYNGWYLASSADTSGTTQDPKLVVVHTSSASGPANLKSYNTNVLANIKSINTNLIANTKSLNTNV